MVPGEILSRDPNEISGFAGNKELFGFLLFREKKYIAQN